MSDSEDLVLMNEARGLGTPNISLKAVADHRIPTSFSQSERFPEAVVGMTTTQPVLRVAIDDGLAQMKLFGEQVGGGYKALKFPTGVNPAGAGGVVDLEGEMVGMYETEEGERFVCSDSVQTEESRFPDFHVSQINRVLIRHALLKAGYAGQKIELFTGLPVDEYFTGGNARNAERINRKIANLKRSVTALSSNQVPPELISVKVGCQAISAYFDYLLDANGQPVMEVQETVAVVDIGGSTTDIAVIMGGQNIDGASSGATRIGVLDVHRSLREKLAQALGLTLRLSPKAIDQACRTRQIKLYGELQDISPQVDAAVRETGHAIIREIDRKIGNGATLDKILLVGGGAALFAQFLSRWRNAEMLKDGEFANARGLLKFAKSQD